jgi:hypothetical protein
MNITREDILKEILTECVSNWQPELADKYHISPSDMSHLLQECGFVNKRFTVDVPGDIDSVVNDALKKERVQKICDKILKMQSQQSELES